MKAFCILFCQKPIEGTYASNCLSRGCGALWIDGGRVGFDEEEVIRTGPRGLSGTLPGDGRKGAALGLFDGTHVKSWNPPTQGRFPANMILDGGKEVRVEFPSVKTGGPGTTKENHNGCTMSGPASNKTRRTIGYNDSGSAVRFFKQFGGQST